MSFPIDNRLQSAINRIENRSRRKPPPRPLRQVRVPNIAKTPEYYKGMIEKARNANEPYLISVYKRAYNLSLAGNRAEIVALLTTANETMRQRRALAVPAYRRRIRGKSKM